jgi:isoleucyl-tRNA synthetase
LKVIEAVGNADDEAKTGLQVLYDVLLNVTILMAPFIPFITVFFYQHLRKFQPSYTDAANEGGITNPDMAGKSDSVYFLRLLHYNESRLNPQTGEAMSQSPLRLFVPTGLLYYVRILSVLVR